MGSLLFGITTGDLVKSIQDRSDGRLAVELREANARSAGQVDPENLIQSLANKRNHLTTSGRIRPKQDHTRMTVRRISLQIGDALV